MSDPAATKSRRPEALHDAIAWYLHCIHASAILATANMQFGQEMTLVMQTTHAQRWQYPNRVDKRLFSSIENVHRYYNLQKLLSLSIKQTCFKRYHHDLGL